MSSRTRRYWQIAGLLVIAGLLLFIGKPLYLVSSAWLGDRHDRRPTPAGFVDDASRMNATHVAEIVQIPSDVALAQAQLRALLARAHAEKLPVSIAGARHSMGGQALAPGGIVIDMLGFNHLELDQEKKLLTAGAGARWAQILPMLDAQGLSVAVMQSNNDFSVGGSLSANCHGWQCQHAPIASTVESFRLVQADGSLVNCSRDEHAELFSLALGGYGLFGIILDAKLRVVPNVRYRCDAEIVPAEQYAARFHSKVGGETGMAYGRLCVVPGEMFLKQAILTAFVKELGEIPALKEGLTNATLRRAIYRAQQGSPAGKELRWMAETNLGETGTAAFFSRNNLFHEAAVVYAEENDDRSDILHEYFIPIERTEQFLEQVRDIVPRHQVDLLNVTIRDVKEDKDTFLRYADRDMFGFVMLFDHLRGAAADKQMESFTQAMIGAALACNGRYYLTYRLHATPDQFRRAYPQADAFFAKKRQYDPDGIFVNQFFLKYGN